MSVHSMNFTPLIQVVIFGGLPSMRARSSFHSPCFQNFGHFSGVTGSGNGALVLLDLGHLVA